MDIIVNVDIVGSNHGTLLGCGVSWWHPSESCALEHQAPCRVVLHAAPMPRLVWYDHQRLQLRSGRQQLGSLGVTWRLLLPNV